MNFRKHHREICGVFAKKWEGSRLVKTYLWLEDRNGKSGYIFCQTFMKQLCPEIVVESKKNNSELVKAVKGLEDTENRYIIVFDEKRFLKTRF